MFVHIFSQIVSHSTTKQHPGNKLDFSFTFKTHQVMCVSPLPTTKAPSCQPDPLDFSWSSLCTVICRCPPSTIRSISSQPGILFLLLETSFAFSMLCSMNIIIKNNTFPWYSCCVLVTHLFLSSGVNWDYLLDCLPAHTSTLCRVSEILLSKELPRNRPSLVSKHVQSTDTHKALRYSWSDGPLLFILHDDIPLPNTHLHSSSLLISLSHISESLFKYWQIVQRVGLCPS